MKTKGDCTHFPTLLLNHGTLSLHTSDLQKKSKSKLRRLTFSTSISLSSSLKIVLQLLPVCASVCCIIIIMYNHVIIHHNANKMCVFGCWLFDLISPFCKQTKTSIYWLTGFFSGGGGGGGPCRHTLAAHHFKGIYDVCLCASFMYYYYYGIASCEALRMYIDLRHTILIWMIDWNLHDQMTS